MNGREPWITQRRYFHKQWLYEIKQFKYTGTYLYILVEPFERLRNQARTKVQRFNEVREQIDCLVYETFFINELKPTLNVQSDSIRAKVFN